MGAAASTATPPPRPILSSLGAVVTTADTAGDYPEKQGAALGAAGVACGDDTPAEAAFPAVERAAAVGAASDAAASIASRALTFAGTPAATIARWAL